MTWSLREFKDKRSSYFSIEFNGLRIADVFPDAGMYRGKVEPEWIISQAKRIVDAMNRDDVEVARTMVAAAEELKP